jgi:hypothetical protein
LLFLPDTLFKSERKWLIWGWSKDISGGWEEKTLRRSKVNPVGRNSDRMEGTMVFFLQMTYRHSTKSNLGSTASPVDHLTGKVQQYFSAALRFDRTMVQWGHDGSTGKSLRELGR